MELEIMKIISISL